MPNHHRISSEPTISNLKEETVANSLLWQCTRCGYSEGVQGTIQGGIIKLDSANDFYIVKWRIFRNENFVEEVLRIYHIKHAVLTEAIRNFRGRLGRIPQSQLGCCGTIRLFALGQSVDSSTIRYEINETRIHQIR